MVENKFIRETEKLPQQSVDIEQALRQAAKLKLQTIWKLNKFVMLRFTKARDDEEIYGMLKTSH